MRKSCSLRKVAHSSSSSTPLVWRVCGIVLPGCWYFSICSHDLAEEGQPHQRRLAALPGEVDLGDLLRLDVLADEMLEHGVAHLELLPGKKISLWRKQYAQSRLQIAPVGLANRWKAGGAPAGYVTGMAGKDVVMVSIASFAWACSILLHHALRKHTYRDKSSRQTGVTEFQSPHHHISRRAARYALPVFLADYCRAIIMRISASLSSITSPLTSNVTLWIVPVNSKGGS